MEKILRADIGLSLSFTTYNSAWDQKMFNNFAELNFLALEKKKKMGDYVALIFWQKKIFKLVNRNFFHKLKSSINLLHVIK